MLVDSAVLCHGPAVKTPLTTRVWVQSKEEQQPEGRPELTAAQKRLKYLKIGAAAVGGGALLAVTGRCIAEATGTERDGRVVEGPEPGVTIQPLLIHDVSEEPHRH